MTLKTYKTAVCASAFLAVLALSGGVFAAGAAGDSYSFESGTFAEQIGLTGNGTVKTENYEYSGAVGKPLSGDHYKVLEIAGTVAYTNNTTSSTPTNGASQVDFMFKVEATDELENPIGDDIKVALAVGTNDVGTTTAPIKLWCKTTSGGSAGWVDLAPAVTTGSWVRAMLVLDYDHSKCSVSLNGDPVLNGTTNTWFYFVNGGGTYVSSITMVGSTMVDDLLVTHAALESYEVPGGANPVPGVPPGSPVTYADLNKYGITVADAVADNDVSGCGAGKISEKLTAGLDPKSATKFELQTMTMTKSTATVTFPGMKTVGSYTVKAKTANGSQVATGAITKASESGENVNSAEVEIPPANQNELLYFTVETN